MQIFEWNKKTTHGGKYSRETKEHKNIVIDA